MVRLWYRESGIGEKREEEAYIEVEWAGPGFGRADKSRILEVLDIIQHPVFVLHFIHHTSLPMCYVTPV